MQVSAPRKNGNQKPPPPEKPRREDIEFYGIDPTLPPLPCGHYLLDYLFEFGPVKGEEAIGPEQLVAWEHLLGIEWKPYESRLLVRLSRAYLGEMHRATKRDAAPPWALFEKPWGWVQKQKGERRLNAFLK